MLTIGPFSVVGVAEAIRKALTMPEERRRHRVERMRDQVRKHNVYRWAARILSHLLRFDLPEGDDAG